MLLKDLRKVKSIDIEKILLALFVALFFATRFPSLGRESINPDAVNWHYRSEQFIVGLKTGDFLKTYQHYHPGVTLMWIMGVPVEILRQFFPTERVYSETNFLVFHTFSKISLVFVQLLLSIVLLYVLEKFFGFKKAFFAVLLVTMEPFFLGNSRLLHMDVLVALFLMLGLCFSHWNYVSFSWIKGIFAGIFLSLAFLTKSIAIGGIMYVTFFGALGFLMEKDFKSLWKYLVSILVPFAAATFLFFPALWKAPVIVLLDIFTEGQRIGIRNGHGQIFFGQYTRDPGVLFYPVVLLMKLSPLSVVGIIIYLIYQIKRFFSRKSLGRVSRFFNSPALFLSIFYFGYLAVMTYPTKKIDRYMIPLFPFLCLIAVLGFSAWVWDFPKFKCKLCTRRALLAVFAALFVVAPIFSYFPYHFTYTSPLFGSSKSANKVIAQKPFGIGIPALKEFILEEYGDYPRLGFVDTKPMRSIYKNSRVFDIRINGTSDYDIMVLGVNEEIPDKVLGSSKTYKLDKTVMINGLEFWRIYVAES